MFYNNKYFNKLKKEKVILVGQTGSGKDFLLRGLIKKGLKYSPKFTTRPRRNSERNGVEYNFIDNNEFEQMLDQDLILVNQAIKINEETWWYGITNKNFQENQLFIMTPHEIDQIIRKVDNKKIFIVYLDIDANVRRSRLIRRNDNNDSIERRIESDRLDFENFNTYDLKITDPEFEVDWIYDLMN